MRYSVLLDAEGYISMISEGGELAGGIDVEAELPASFWEDIGSYKMQDGMLIHDAEKSEALRRLAATHDEIAELEKWFSDYDLQVAQYNRCVRLGVPYDKGIQALDTEAAAKQMRIRELRGGIANA